MRSCQTENLADACGREPECEIIDQRDRILKIRFCVGNDDRPVAVHKFFQYGIPPHVVEILIGEFADAGQIDPDCRDQHDHQQLCRTRPPEM